MMDFISYVSNAIDNAGFDDVMIVLILFGGLVYWYTLPKTINIRHVDAYIIKEYNEAYDDFVCAKLSRCYNGDYHLTYTFKDDVHFRVRGFKRSEINELVVDFVINEISDTLQYPKAVIKKQLMNYDSIIFTLTSGD